MAMPKLHKQEQYRDQPYIFLLPLCTIIGSYTYIKKM